jgi:transcriptional regulator with XRE-family HTH domain
MDQVAERLAELRERRALTLRELGQMSGVAADTINQIELGHRKARPSTLRKLARALDIEVADFFKEPALPKVEVRAEPGRSRGESPENVDNLEVLRRLEKGILDIAKQCRTNLESIDVNAPDRKATADQLISLLGQAFWSHTGAKHYLDHDEVVQEAAKGAREERRAVRDIYTALATLYNVFDDIGAAIESFAEAAGKGAAARVFYAEERFRTKRAS